MKNLKAIIAIATVAVSTASAQMVASHAPTAPKAKAQVSSTALSTPRPIARVNGAVLTENDLIRMEYSMFPYARMHNGIPKDMEPEVRKGAMEMIIFEELLYQEAKRRQISVPAQKLGKAEAAFRQQFPNQQEYEKFLKVEATGSKAVMREKIRRSLLIEQMLKAEVLSKSSVTIAAAKAYYEKNSKQFEHGETFTFQTISMLPPQNATAADHELAKKKIKDVVRIGREAKTARDFGVLAEQISEDDWRTHMGNRGEVPAENMPPEVVAAARKMKVGDVSDVIQLGTAYTVIRLNAHKPAGKSSFEEVKKKLISDLEKQRNNEIRAALNKRLHQGAKIELL